MHGNNLDTGRTDSPYQPLIISHLEAKFIFNLCKHNINFFLTCWTLCKESVFFFCKVDALMPPSNSVDQHGGLMTTFSCSFAHLLQPCLLTWAHFVSFISLETFLYTVSSAAKQCLFCRQHYCTLVTCSLMVRLLKQNVSSGLWPMHLSSCQLVYCIFLQS